MIQRLSLLALVLLPLGTLPAAAVTVSVCNEMADVRAVAEPWEANTKTFAKGDIRLVVLDTVEPAAGAFHLVILHPPRDELGSPMCSMVSAAEGIGFSDMGLAPATAGYDPARGLVVTLPVALYNADTTGFDRATLSVTINQSSGQVQASVE